MSWRVSLFIIDTFISFTPLEVIRCEIWWTFDDKILRFKIHYFLAIRGSHCPTRNNWHSLMCYCQFYDDFSFNQSTCIKFSCYLCPQEKTYLRPTSNSKASTTYPSNDDRSFAKPATITAPPPQPQQQQQQLQAALTAAVAAATATITTSQGQPSMSLSLIQFNHCYPLFLRRTIYSLFISG